jgi:XTP/dITP diphosphohydrolase
MPETLLLGTHNPGKIHEIKLILGDVGWTLRSLRDFENVGVAEEHADSYAGNAILKAQFYARATETLAPGMSATRMLALADDSGLEVEALGGAPGVLSARYAGDHASDADRRNLLLSELAKTGSDNRRARFVCAVALAAASGEVLNLSEGICEGFITLAPRGTSGFGYDPLFVPDGYDQTFAELSDEIKNQISHRARALIKVRDYLRS